ncbi:MAG: hypothetical protein HQL55_00525 [Magnetococcales bacterium]|nr:hypothetical protein [Magnetococcales bacterium]
MTTGKWRNNNHQEGSMGQEGFEKNGHHGSQQNTQHPLDNGQVGFNGRKFFRGAWPEAVVA